MFLSRSTISVALAALLALACDPADQRGAGPAGANPGESSAAPDGSPLQLGKLLLSPDGRFAVQHADRTFVTDLQAGTVRALHDRWAAVVFASSGHVAYASLGPAKGIARIDLATLETTWSVVPAFQLAAGASFMRLSEDDRTLVLGDAERVFRVDASTGDILGTTPVAPGPRFAEPLPGQDRMVVVSTARWEGSGPHASVASIDLATGAAVTLEIPNCASTPVMVDGGRRILISPTFCAPGQAEVQQGFASVDPISVVDVVGSSLQFRRNLPGFGPVALSDDGTRALAYLDVERVDASLFEDPSEIPAEGGPRYHLMLLDPRTLEYDVVAVGDVLPRFAFTHDAETILVDSNDVSESATYGVRVQPGAQGVEATTFQKTSSSHLGLLDWSTQVYRPIEGPIVRLDRWIELPSGGNVVAVSAAGRSTGPFASVDLATATSHRYEREAGDVGLLPDGKLLVSGWSDAAPNAPPSLCASSELPACELLERQIEAADAGASSEEPR